MVCRVFVPRKEPLLLSAVNDSVVRISPPSRWNGAPTTARKHRCSLMGVLFCLGRRTEGVQGTSGKPPACVGVRQLCRKGTHSGGLTRRLRRERWGSRPERGSTFFRCERKYQRKPAARRLQRRPAPLCVIRKYRHSGHCRARPLYLLRPASR